MTERAQNADFRREPQIFADSPLEIQALGDRRKPQKTEDFRRKPQIGLRHLRSVSFRSARSAHFGLLQFEHATWNDLSLSTLEVPLRPFLASEGSRENLQHGGSGSRRVLERRWCMWLHRRQFKVHCMWGRWPHPQRDRKIKRDRGIHTYIYIYMYAPKTSSCGHMSGIKKSKSRVREGKLRQKKADRRKKQKLGNMKNPHLFGGGYSWSILTIKPGNI